MERVCFENVRLMSGVDYFLYIGEIKAFGLNEFVRQGLERRFGRPFMPIGICPDILTRYPFENVIVINPWARRPRVTMEGGEAERVSAGPFVAHISASRYVRSMARMLAERQERVFVWMFESRPEFHLFDDVPGLTMLGPDADLVYRVNDKTWQYQTFSEVVPVVDFAVCEGRDAMLDQCRGMLDDRGNGVFVSCAYSAGGVSSKVVRDLGQAERKFLDPGGRFLLSRYHPHVWDPTVLGVVGNADEVFIGGVADMTIVDGNKFRGSTFPSRLGADAQRRLRKHTRAVGRKLGELGFRGIFGCDYIVDAKGDIFFIEVNPRKQGTTMEYCCALEHLLPDGAPNMPELETWAVLDGFFPANTVELDHERAAECGLHWGTFNHKIERRCVHTSGGLPQRLPERELFRRVASGGKSGHVILEHVGADVDVLPGTFMGRVAAVGSSRRNMLAALGQRQKKAGVLHQGLVNMGGIVVAQESGTGLDGFTRELLDGLSGGAAAGEASGEWADKIAELADQARDGDGTAPIVRLFGALKDARREAGLGYEAFGLTRGELEAMCARHVEIDEHGVTVGGRVGRALEVMAQANPRVEDYLARKDVEAASGIELWESILENQARIKKALNIDDATWNSFGGQLKNAINDVETLARCVDLPADTIRDVTRVTKKYRMRLTPYYASLIQPGTANDPVLLQSVPTSEMVDNVGVELPPVVSDHSPARLIDQFYPRVVAVKVTNICAMYCTHCLRIAHIGKSDRTFPRKAYQEALDYIAGNERIRDVLITGGDAFMLNNENLRWLLGRLDEIDHVRLKRLGTRVPVTTPQRVDDELLDILEESNERGPVRVVTQINTAQEITPVSRQAFKDISRRVMAVLNQAVLLRGINDSRPKMWKLCETIQEAYVRPYYVFNCSYRNPQYTHMRVPIETGRDIVEGMYGNISGDAVPLHRGGRGQIPLHRDNLVRRENGDVILRKPWSGEETAYPDALPEMYGDDADFAFNKYGKVDGVAEVRTPRIRSWLDERRDEMLSLLERLVRINSHTANKAGVDAVGAVLEETMLGMGFSVRRHPREKVGDNLVALSPAASVLGPKAGRVLFCGHMDTVFPDDGSFDCFRREGETVVGPGVVDMKGGLVAGIYALRALDAAGLLADLPVAFVFNSDEETGSCESRELIMDEAGRSALAFVFECAGLSGETCTGRKGKTSFKLRVSGRAGHAGNLSGPKASAVLELAHKTIALEALNDPERGVSVNVGLVSGGVGPNTVAPAAEAVVECRYRAASDAEALREAVAALAAVPDVAGTGVAVETVPGRPPMEQSAANRGLLEHVMAAGRELGVPVVEDFRGGVSDANYIASVGTPVLDGLGPCGARDHSPREFMVVDSLAARAALAAVAARRAWDAAGAG